jgi:hypothetical protein
MNSADILAQYEKLPDNYKREAADFIEFLLNKSGKNDNGEKSGKRNGLGSLKGLIHMEDDFDEPLEEFKDYM